MILLALTIANLKIIFRNRQSLFWALAFPLIFVAVFGLFFSEDQPQMTVSVVDHSRDSFSLELVSDLSNIDSLEVIALLDEEEARRKLEKGDFGYLLIIPPDLDDKITAQHSASITLLYDESNALSAVVSGTVQNFLSQVNLSLANALPLLLLDAQGISSPILTYFDFLLPGFVGMALMTYAVIGLGSVLASYREQRILKRILATPLPIRTFFVAQVMAHMILSLIQAIVVLGAGVLVFGGHIYGNYIHLAVLVLLGNLVFLSMGFIVGAIARNAGAASGLGNAVTLPMMFLSGVFFPKDGLPNFVSYLAEYLPLTPLVHALRGVALDARPIWAFPGELILLGAWIVLTSIVATRLFRYT